MYCWDDLQQPESISSLNFDKRSPSLDSSEWMMILCRLCTQHHKITPTANAMNKTSNSIIDVIKNGITQLLLTFGRATGESWGVAWK